MYIIPFNIPIVPILQQYIAYTFAMNDFREIKQFSSLQFCIQLMYNWQMFIKR